MAKFEELKTLPKGWKWVRLGEVAELIYGEGLNIDKYKEDGGTIVYGTGGILGFTDKHLDIGESIVIPRKGTINSKTFIPKDTKFWVIDTAFYLKLGNNDIDMHYLYYFFETVDFNLLNEATGVPSLNRVTLYRMLLPLPPLPEQQKIAEILETVDNAIEKTEQIIEKYKRIKQGLMQELLTKGIDENGKIRTEKTHKFKDSPIGRIPE
ncbi:hypothetical protein JCM13991_19300 [Thermodesulfovibrio hydrogeniphilus]